MKVKKILLGHLNSNGDCLFATNIARQIKEVDYPNCHLTWAVNSKCKQSVVLNPHIDEVWEIPTRFALTSPEEWDSFVSEAERRKKNGEFDVIFLTQIFGVNWFNYDGGIRSSIYNNYPHPITLSHELIIQLSAAEIENVRNFAEKYRLVEYKQVVLVECGADSFETALNRHTAYELASEIISENKDVAFILSSNKQVLSEKPNIIDGSQLTFRENAELTKYCHLFIGCASGISWLATSTWAKKLKMVLVINQNHNPLSSMIYDHEYFNLPSDHIIEIKSDDEAIIKLKNCLRRISVEDFASARKSFNEKIKLKDLFFLDYQLRTTLDCLDLGKFCSCLMRCIKRNKMHLFFNTQFWKIWGTLLVLLTKKFFKLLGLKRIY